MRNILRIIMCGFATAALAQTSTVTVNTSTGITQPAIGQITLKDASNFFIKEGTGTPEGVVTATTGALFLDRTGKLWLKATGSGNTGWYDMTSSGSGTVTSVDFAAPNGGFTITGNPITTSGTITATQHVADATHDGYLDKDDWSRFDAAGDFSTNTSTSVDKELVIFSGTSGKLGTRATGSGIVKLTSGVYGFADGGIDYLRPTETSLGDVTWTFDTGGDLSWTFPAIFHLDFQSSVAAEHFHMEDNIGFELTTGVGHINLDAGLSLIHIDSVSGNITATAAGTGDLTLEAAGSVHINAPDVLLDQLTSNGFVKTGSGDGTLSVDTNTYLTGNQTITLSGDASGSGTTSIAVTNAQAAKLTTARNLWGQSFDGSANIGGNIELGSAGTTDTTLARSGAGDATIEGNAIYRAGGTDVALADGGTGASLTDPGANTLMGWDDTDNATKFITIGTNLSYDHSSHTLSATGGGGGTTSKVSGSDFTTSSGSMDNITGLTFAASSNTSYEVDALLRVQHTSTSGIKFQVNYSAGSPHGQFICIATQAVNGTGQQYEANTVNVSTQTAQCTTANTDFTVIIKGIIVTTGSAGNITIMMQRLGVGQTATCYIGSRMTVTQL